MIETKVAKRYAKSLIDLSKENGSIDAVNNDMKLFVAICDQNRDLGLLLANPIIHGYKKLAILTSVFGSRVSKLTISFFEIVTRKGREKYLIHIAKQFTEQYKEFKGIQTAEITSAIGLDDKLRASVFKSLQDSTRSEIELIEKVDKKLIGGFVLRLGDKQYDASIVSELRKLAQTFSKNPTIQKN